jgi:hypothetical protein
MGGLREREGAAMATRTKTPKALIANPLRAIRHADGFHARTVVDKRAYVRHEKHRDRRDW